MHKPQGTIIDVRTSGEFDAGHVPGAINVPLDQLPLLVDECRTMAIPITVYCQSGGRSERAATFLRSKGVLVTDGGSMRSVQQQLVNNGVEPTPAKKGLVAFFTGPLGMYRLVRIGFALFFFSIGLLYADGWMAFIFGAIFLATAFAKRPLCIGSQCALDNNSTNKNNKLQVK